MFFSFRWLLVLFKREFPFDKVLKLWEVSLSLLFLFHLILVEQLQRHQGGDLGLGIEEGTLI